MKAILAALALAITLKNMRFQTAAFCWIAVLASWIAPAAAWDCVTPKQTASGPPYAEFDLVNECRGAAIVHWTRTDSKGNPEPGKWFVSGCNTAHEQYFPGKYDFGDVEFPRGGENEKCLSKEDAARRNDVPQQHPSSQAPKSSGTQKSSGTSAKDPASPQAPNNDLARRIEHAKKQADTAPLKNQQYHEQLRTAEQAAQEQYRVEKDKNDRAQQAATIAKQRDAELEDARRRRELEEAKRWLCFSDYNVCNVLCNIVNRSAYEGVYPSWGRCNSSCRQPQFTRYCVNINPNYRAAIIARLRDTDNERILRDLPPE